MLQTIIRFAGILEDDTRLPGFTLISDPIQLESGGTIQLKMDVFLQHGQLVTDGKFIPFWSGEKPRVTEDEGLRLMMVKRTMLEEVKTLQYEGLNSRSIAYDHPTGQNILTQIITCLEQDT